MLDEEGNAFDGFVNPLGYTQLLRVYKENPQSTFEFHLNQTRSDTWTLQEEKVGKHFKMSVPQGCWFVIWSTLLSEECDTEASHWLSTEGVGFSIWQVNHWTRFPVAAQLLNNTDDAMVCPTGCINHPRTINKQLFVLLTVLFRHMGISLSLECKERPHKQGKHTVHTRLYTV